MKHLSLAIIFAVALVIAPGWWKAVAVIWGVWLQWRILSERTMR